MSALREANNIHGTHLSINQKLTIPRINGVPYSVQKGDTLSTIAEKYGIVDTNSILLANNMDRRGVLSVGKKLLLPNPTKDPNKKVVVVPIPEKKPVVPALPIVAKPTVTKRNRDPVNQKTISYGGYSLDLKVDH